MSSIHRTRRPGTGLALAAVLGLGTSFGLMASPALAEPGNGNGTSQGNAHGNGHAGAPATPAGQAAPQTAQSGPDRGKPDRGNPDRGKQQRSEGKDKGKPRAEGSNGHGHPGSSKPGSSSPGKGTDGNPGSSNPGSGQGAGNGGGHNGSGATPAQGDPAGNNGTIKIAPVPHADGIPQNHPHPGCQFQIEWYGFDADAASPVTSTVGFAVQAPTGGDVAVTSGDTTKSVGGDSASGAGTDTGFDGAEVYTLAFTGTPHPQQGYHVKVTVSTPFSQGNDTKSKVFWVSGCETPVAPETPVVPGETPVVPETGVVPEVPAVAPDTTTETDVLGEEATGEEDTDDVAAEENPTANVLGEQATLASTVLADTVLGTAGSRAGQVVVPTVINAGVAGKDASEASSAARSVLALVLLLLGGAAARLAWLHRAGA